MAKGALRCPKCSRTFSMPAHLARHMNTIHSSGKSKVKVKVKAKGKAKPKPKKRAGRPKLARKKLVRRARPVRVGRPAGRPATTGAGRLISEMQAYLRDLSTRRAALDAEMAAITTALEAMGRAVPGAKARRGPGRPPGGRMRPGSLKDFIVRVLKQRSPMGPSEITAAVRKAGYKSTAKDLAKAVSNSLPEIKIVKKAGFGIYRI